MNNNLSYLLVRSNPDKKNSVHYGDKGLLDALSLQSQLAAGRHNRAPESTELYVLDVERGLCTLVTTMKYDGGE